MTYFYIILISYLIGNISGGYILGKIIKKKDIRKYGSGNAGTTNAFRVFGKSIGVLTFIIDFLKGMLIVYIVKRIFSPFYVPIAILFCVIGHNYPFYMKFKGGKGVATTIGALSLFNFKLALIGIFIWIMVVLLTKIVSLGSISFFIVELILFCCLTNYTITDKLFFTIIFILGIYRHKDNIKRLIQKRENKIGGAK